MKSESSVKVNGQTWHGYSFSQNHGSEKWLYFFKGNYYWKDPVFAVSHDYGRKGNCQTVRKPNGMRLIFRHVLDCFSPEPFFF